MNTAEELDTLFDEIERCREWIQAALDRSGGTHDFKDIVDGILTNKMQFWPSEKACIITEIIQFPKQKHLHIFLAGGELNQILDHNDSLKEFARFNGCCAITIAGRAGWKKVLKELGYYEKFVVLRQEIDQ